MRIDRNRRAMTLGVFAAALLVCGVLTASASAVVVKVGGHFYSVAPVRGSNPAASPAGRAAQASLKARKVVRTAANGNLDYLGGPVLHGTTPYVIFWDPTGTGISAASRALITRYFTDFTADSGKNTNVYAVNRQFFDSTGIANYSQAFSAGNVINDTTAFPATPSVSCPTAVGYPNCLNDSQLRAEVANVRAAHGLPAGISGNAPMYFIIVPTNVNTCFDDYSDCEAGGLSGNNFCAFHSSFKDSSHDGATVIYSDTAMMLAGQDPKGCQNDGISTGGVDGGGTQEPNGDIADVVTKYIEHEHSESITDPLVGITPAWVNNNTGGEDGDQCNGVGDNAKAFLPVLGGDPTPGTLFDQVANGHAYYIQSEWSNGDNGCTMRPTASTIAPAFSVSGSGTTAVFNPTGSGGSQAFSSETWNFGDGAASFSSTFSGISHTYPGLGAYNASLTIVDAVGNANSVTHTIIVPAHITKVRKTKHNGKRNVVIKVSVDFAGTIHVNKKSKHLGKAGTAKFTIKLSGGQKAKLDRKGKLTIKIKIKFVSSFGSVTKKTVKVTFHR